MAAGQTNMRETYSRLARSGWNVSVHATRDSFSEKDCFLEKEIVQGIKVMRYRSYGYGYGFLPKLNFRDNGIIRIHNFHLLPNFSILMYCFLLKLLKRKSFILIFTPHGGFTPDWSIFPKWQVVIKRSIHYIATFFIKSTVDGIIAVSDCEKKQIIQRGIKPELIKVIYNGIEKEAYEDIEIETNKKTKELVENLGQYIIQVGTVCPRKNQEVVIKALPFLSADIKFAVVGPFEDDEYFRRLQDLIEKSKLQNRVIFVGIMTGYDKYYLMRYAQVIVHMAKDEIYGNVVHEGMSQGCICVVSKDTAVTEFIKEGINGYHADPYDHRDVAGKLNFVLENQRKANVRSIKRNNVKVTRDHSWDNTACQLEEYLLKQLNRS